MEKKCINCKWCTWTCPDWMRINPKHPGFEEGSTISAKITLRDGCDLFEAGENDRLILGGRKREDPSTN